MVLVLQLTAQFCSGRVFLSLKYRSCGFLWTFDYQRLRCVDHVFHQKRFHHDHHRHCLSHCDNLSRRARLNRFDLNNLVWFGDQSDQHLD